MALLRVLNRKCGRMRACNSDRRAAVAAGACALARIASPTTSRAENSAPANTDAVHGTNSRNPASASTPQPYRPASAPRLTPAAYWP